jgi:hypothetical protein
MVFFSPSPPLYPSNLFVVGIVLKRDNIPYVYESSVKEYIVDVDRQSVQNGVMLSPLKERLYDFYGVICWRPLTVPNRQNGEFEEIMEAIVKENQNKYYDDAQKEGLIITLNLQHFQNLERFFCSELVASCYQRLGLLSPHRASNTYICPDFSSTGYEITPKTKYRQLSPQDAMAKLHREATLGSELELIPHWATEKENSPKITEMLEEDLHIFNGLGIIEKELHSISDSTLFILLEAIHGLDKEDFGHKADNFIEHLLKPITSQNLVITARVGQVPFYPTVPFQRCSRSLKEGQVSSLPWVIECETKPELKRLKVWISIEEEDLFSKGEYLGALCVDPHTLPIIERGTRKRSCGDQHEQQKEQEENQLDQENEKIQDKKEEEGSGHEEEKSVLSAEFIFENIPSLRYPTQQGYWEMKCWIERN